MFEHDHLLQFATKINLLISSVKNNFMVSQLALLKARERRQAIDLLKSGVSCDTVAMTFRVSKRTLRRWRAAVDIGSDLADKPRKGRPKSWSVDDRRAVESLLRQPKFGSIRRVAARVNIPRSTVARIARIARIAASSNLRARCRPRRNLVPATATGKRIRFAKLWQSSKQWKSWVFEDESRFEAFVESKHEWVSEGEQPRPRFRVQHPPAVTVLAAISWYGKSRLVILGGNERINAIQYQDVLSSAIVPDIKKVFQDAHAGSCWLMLAHGTLFTTMQNRTLQRPRRLGWEPTK